MRPSESPWSREKGPTAIGRSVCTLAGEGPVPGTSLLRTSGANLRHHEQERGSRRRAGLGDMAERETPPQECTGDGRTDGRRDGHESLGTDGEEGRGTQSCQPGGGSGSWRLDLVWNVGAGAKASAGRAVGTGQKHLRERTAASGRSDGWFSFGKLHGCEPASPASPPPPPPPPQREGERTGDPDDPCPEWIATERLRTGGPRGAPRVRPLCEQVDGARGHECKTRASDNTMGPPGSALVTLE